MTYVVKRDGRTEEFVADKISSAIMKAARKVGGSDQSTASSIAEEVYQKIYMNGEKEVGVDEIHDLIEKVLTERGHYKTAKEYILYRDQKKRARNTFDGFMETMDKITFTDAKDLDEKRENGNIDADTAMGTMLKYGSESAKMYNLMNLMGAKASKAHLDGDIHIHDLDFAALTTTCTQIDLGKLFKGGFSTGHGFLREPNSIGSYSALACIAIQSNQNDQHGGQSVPNFDYYMADGVKKSFAKEIVKVGEIVCCAEARVGLEGKLEELKKLLKSYPGSILSASGIDYTEEKLKVMLGCSSSSAHEIVELALRYTEKDTYQAMESLVHNLNSMHSRAGSQVPFSSLNYGTDTSEEGRMATRWLLQAIDDGLGNGETPIFPISIFKVKDGINYKKGDKNYDLFQQAIKVSAKRMYPNFSFLDAPYNLKYYKQGDIDTEIAYMGCRTRVIGNIYDKEREIVTGRGNLSFTSINLPRIAIKAEGLDEFYRDLDDKLEIVLEQLISRFYIQANKKVINYPFLMGQGVWIDSENLARNDRVEEVLKHGTLSIGFIGLAETLVALTGKHHGESEESQKLGIEIVKYMRDFADRKSEEYKLNITLLATPAEGLSGRFLRIDKKLFGEIAGVTDREYYTNSFHIPVYYGISAIKKIQLEAPYHALTNAGHITYVEMDGDATKNLDAFEQIIRCMKESGIGYGAVNHPIDRDPVCGYTGIIDDVCPRCGRREGEAISEEKLRELQRKYTNVGMEIYSNR